MAFRKVNVNWRTKAAAFKLLDTMPFGQNAYYLLQRYVTKSIPRVMSPTAVTGSAQISHATKFAKYGVDLGSSRLFEFGAGWDLYSNLILYCLGANRQISIDVRRWAKAEAVNFAIRHLQQDPPPGAVRVPETPVRQDRLDEDLLNLYGISYRAPADARAVDVENGGIDLIATTSVLEHVPEDILRDIIKECARILKSGGFMSHAVDYSDHYAHSDPDIGEYNYLGFSDEGWKRYNPSIHFQNRLRTPAFEKMFRDNGFEILESVPRKGDENEFLSVVADPAFNRYTEDELRVLRCDFLLRKR